MDDNSSLKEFLQTLVDKKAIDGGQAEEVFQTLTAEKIGVKTVGHLRGAITTEEWKSLQLVNLAVKGVIQREILGNFCNPLWWFVESFSSPPRLF